MGISRIATFKAGSSATGSHVRESTHMRNKSGFTLIEVLVVVAIIALLIAILMPSLARARAETRSVVCRSSMRQLMYGQLLYVQDFKRLPATISTFYYNCTPPSLSLEQQLARRDLFTWEGAYSVANTNKNKLIPRKGTIFRFVKSEDMYVCPDDKPGEPLDLPHGGGGNGFLSYSMNAFLGWKNPDFRAFTYRKNEGGLDPNGNFKTFKMGQTVKYTASMLPVLFEEHPRYNINNTVTSGGFGEGNFNYTDRIATRHGLALGEKSKGRTNLAYLDGHAETKLYSWETEGYELFREVGIPSGFDTASQENVRAFMTLCEAGQCPR